ncbi:hypothetical protein ACX0G9_28665 [Flavitalea flava]
MSLNNIELPEKILTELYRDTLVALETPYKAKERKKDTTEDNPEEKIPGRAAASQAAGRVVNTNAEDKVPEIQTAEVKPAEIKSKEVKPAEPQSLVPEMKILGLNKKKITILVKSPGVAFLPDDQLAFLTKILEACRMNMGDVAIVNLASAPVPIAELKRRLQPAFLILFGIEPVEIKLPMNFPAFKIQDYDQTSYLYASSLNELVAPTEESKLLKSKLWVCLKSMFQV